jgi:cephalosporin-C deacetylase-like acetyl esterase
MQELTDSIKRPNLTIMAIEEEEVQAKGMYNIFNKINNRKLPKSRENDAHSGTGSLQNTKQT